MISIHGVPQKLALQQYLAVKIKHANINTKIEKFKVCKLL